MAVQGQNLCSPARIYGPLSQYIFCGCSVKTFSVSAGWNEQSSSMTVEVVQDPCVSEKIWWDKTLQRQTGSIADPGFTSPDPGCAVYFRIEEDPDGATEADRGGFEYCGLIESWTESFDSNGNPSYSIRLTDPRAVLENTQVIVGDTLEAHGGVWNLINAYAFVESLGYACSSSSVGAIGGVTNDNSIGNIANERGIAWNDLKCAIHTLTASIDHDQANALYWDYCKDTRIIYVGPENSSEGYGVIEKDDTITEAAYQTITNANLNVNVYRIDLTEIPFSPLHYRISGPNISLMEIISQVCADAGCDYYIELIPVYIAGVIEKVVKVRISNRSSQPQLGKLDEFIAAKQSQAAHANGGILSYTKGEELRNEATSIYLIGGKKRIPVEASVSEIQPYWGKDTDGNLISATISSNEYLINLDMRRLNGSLNTAFSNFAIISEGELRAALGDLDSWKSVAIAQGGAFATYLASINQSPILDFDINKKVFEGDAPPLAAWMGQPEVNSDDINMASNSAKDLDKVYEFVRSYAEEFYGKQFIVNVSSVCYALDAESNKYRYSHSPSTEGCWVTDGTSTVLGLTHNSSASDFFRDDQGKYQPIIAFPIAGASTIGGGGGSLIPDPSKLGDGNYIANATYIWVKADIESEWIVGTPLDTSASTFSCVLKVGSPVVNNTSDTNDLMDVMNGLDIANAKEGVGVLGVSNVVERANFILSGSAAAIKPYSALVPILSNNDVYGPWGQAGLPGQVSLQTDEGFVPWEYGSDVVMASAATDKTDNTVTQMRKGERGTVAVAGFPNIPLCAELFSVDTASPPDSQGTQKYVGSRIYSVDHCASTLAYMYVPMNAWTGEFGPNVTNVNVSVGAGGFTTEYQFSTYTPRYGRFSKNNSERLKKIGQSRLQNMRNMRSRAALNRRGGNLNIRSKQMIENQIARSARAPKSAHHLFIGRYVGADRPEVNTQSAKEATLAFSSDSAYAGSAMMSLDGLIRPVSKNGDGSLPQFINEGASDCVSSKDTSNQADPPVNEYARLDWGQQYLDPFANAGDSLPTNRDNAASPSGHDIEVLGRGTAAPSASWSIVEGGERKDDYRFFAMRGPIVIQQWGRDKHGKPVPNAADTDANAEAGTFTSSALEDKFLDNWLQKPKTWPVAPLDLVLDRERGVWTTPQPPRIIHAIPAAACLLNSPTSVPSNLGTVYDTDGSTVASTTINANWPWTINPPTGVGKIPTYYDNVDCAYYALPINRFDVRVTGGPRFYDIKQIHFGDGLKFGGIEGNGFAGGFAGGFLSDGCNNIINIEADTASGTYIRAIGQCDSTEQLPAVSLDLLTIGSGLDLTTETVDGFANAFRLESHIFAEGSSTEHGVLGPTQFTYLNFIGNLETWNNGCEIVVSGVGSDGGNVSGVGVCHNIELGSTTFDTLVFGTGLQVTDQGANQYRIDNSLAANGRTSMCAGGSETYIGKTGIATFSFGSGIEIADDGCTLDISAPHYISGIEVCNHMVEQAKVPFRSLTFGTGLGVTSAGNCDFRIDSVITASGRTDMADSNSYIEKTGVPTFAFGSGIEIADNGCNVMVSAPQYISGVNPCGLSNTIGKSAFTTLVFGTGIKITDEGNQQYRLDNRFLVAGFDVSSSPSTNFVTDIKLDGYDFYTADTPGNSCSVNVYTNLKASGDGSCLATPVAESRFETLIFGTGLQVSSGGTVNGRDRIHIDSIISASGLDDSSPVGPQQFDLLKFVGNLDTSIVDNCTIQVSGIGGGGSISGANTCNTTEVAKTEFDTLIFGTGLQVTDMGSNDYRIDNSITASGYCSTCSSSCKSGPFPVTDMIFGSGLTLAQADDDCTIIIESSRQTIEKSENLCVADLGTPENGEGVVSKGHFTNLNIGTGLRLIDNGSCDFTLMGGVKIREANCAGPEDANGNWFSRIVISSGLEAEYSDDGCEAMIKSALTAHSIAVSGQVFTHSASCGALSTDHSSTSSICSSSTPDKGPYKFRKMPAAISTLSAGAGIGLTSQDHNPCQLYIFNNTKVDGKNGCTLTDYLQVNQFSFTPDLNVTGGGNDGGAVDGSTGSLNAQIGINEGGDPWSMEFVSSITCTKSGGYVTDIEVICNSFSGSRSCNNKFWITSTGGPDDTCCTTC